ncbi:MAG: hypothetical protein FWH16_00575 [Oscillospiraceae bacterium]|nr:hypothetical protein [Oscillospiraceae bacterium]
MLITLEAASKLIADGKTLHIAGTEAMLRKLPKGNWIGGSTEYFMTKDGGSISGELLFVTELPYETVKIKSYDAQEISQIAEDAFDSGFSIVIIPFDSAVHKEYAQNAPSYGKMFLNEIVGWIAGVNLGIPGQTPIAVNGLNAEAFADKAVALHMQTPENITVSINIINIFEQDMASPVLEFEEEGFHVAKCFADGKETVFSDYLTENAVNTKLPLVGDYAGHRVNVSIKSVEDGVVNLYAPVFNGIKYRMAKDIKDYAAAFRARLKGINDDGAVFSCNCILNFLYGELEGRSIEAFAGPITFGEIAYQLVNQTLVYVTEKER